MQPKYKQFNQNKPKWNSDVAAAVATGSTVAAAVAAAATSAVASAAVPVVPPQRLFAQKSMLENSSAVAVAVAAAFAGVWHTHLQQTNGERAWRGQKNI